MNWRSFGNLAFTNRTVVIDHLTAEQLKRYRFAFPLLHEQAEIADNCLKRLSRISESHEKITYSMNRLTEYRAALITAAVTGQIAGLR